MTALEKINELRTASINFLISRMKYRAQSRDLNGHSVRYRNVGGNYCLYNNENTFECTIAPLVMRRHYRSEETPVNILADDAMPMALIYEEPASVSGSGLSLYVYDTYSKKYGYVRFDDLCLENIDLVLSHL